MAVYKRGRLYRKLFTALQSISVFGMYCEPLDTLYDADIHSIVIHRGKSGRGGGSHPSTLEITVNGRYAQQVAGKNVRVFIRDAPAAELAATLGTTADAIKQRFTGRMGQTSIEDTGKRYTTTFGAASWIAQMSYSPVYFDVPAGMSTVSALYYLAHADDPNRGISVVMHGDGGLIATDQGLELWKDGVTKYAEDIGILLQERRNGETHILPHLWRMNEAQVKLNSALPLTRSQAISPATWAQNNERPAIRIEYLITNAAGGVAMRVAEVANETGEVRETVAEDWSYIKSANVDNQLYREAYARVLESSIRQFTVPSVTVDLLMLISSPHQYHRDQAAQLLAMEAGDPVYFSGDWPTPLQGIHFAEGITESIDPDNWTMELSLVPYAQVVGDTPAPTVPARVWDSLGTAVWDEQTKTWNEA